MDKIQVCQLKQRIFISFLLLAMVFAFGCGKRKRTAPEYDSRRAELLFAACDAIHAGDTARSMEALGQLTKDYPSDRFPPVAFRQEQKRELLNQANHLLGEVSLNQLEQLLRDTEAQGLISPEMLAYSQIKNALDQLRIFVSRMPWTSAAALRQNLRNLDAYDAVLRQSPSYDEFRKQQDVTLEKLRADESRAAVENTAAALELALISGNGLSRARNAYKALATAQQGNFFTRALAMTNASAAKKLSAEAASDKRKRSLLEIAALEQWDKLAVPSREAVLGLLRQKGATSLAGKWLAAKNKLTPSAASDFLAELSGAHVGCTPRQEIVREFMEKHLLSQAHYAAWCWRSPCPGAGELVARLKQIGQWHSANNK